MKKLFAVLAVMSLILSAAALADVIPGVEDGVLTVHCIRPGLLEDTENGRIVRLLRRMEA